MDFIPEGDSATLAIDTEMDVRSVAVLWVDQTITVDFSNCSAYEALGLIRTAAALLEQDCVEGARMFDDPEDEEDDDDEDE